jgi:hypothetical protein
MSNSAPADPISELVERQIAFENFNFCGHTDTPPIPLNQLQKWAFQAQHGDRDAAKQFANTMLWTLRYTTFAAYLKRYSLKLILYTAWYLEKIHMFVRILLDSDPGTPYLERPWKSKFRVPGYSDAYLESDHLLFQLKPEHYERLDFHELVLSISEHPEDRQGALLAWLKKYIKPVGVRMPRELASTARRNNLIRQALPDNKSGREICEILDRNGIPTTKEMRKNKIFEWTVAWDDPDFTRNVQTMISKAKARG